MKRLVLVPLTALVGLKGQPQQVQVVLDTLTQLAQQLKEELKTPSYDVTVLCSSAPSLEAAGKIFETVFPDNFSFKEELWCGDGRAAQYGNLFKFVQRQRTAVVILLVSGDYAESYGGYHTSMENFPLPLAKLQLKAGECAILNKEKGHPGYRTAEIFKTKTLSLA